MSTSSINFEAAYRNAELKRATDVLREWLNSHSELSYFTFDQIASSLPHSVPLDQINRVLLRLVAAGELEVKYRVKINEGEYSEAEFDSRDLVPEVVFDSSFEPFSVSDDDKVPSYTPAR